MTNLTLPNFTLENHTVWNRMLTKQMNIIEQNIDHISMHLIRGIEIAELHIDKIPNVLELSNRLEKATGRRLCDAEDPFLSHDRWFEHLAHKRFPVTNYIRTMENFEFTPLPDLFHEYFGHMPQMFQSFFADIEEKTALLHQKAITQKQKKDIFNISRRTIEYGVLRENGTEKCVGTGILSSPGDLKYFCNNGFILEDASLEKLISTPPSPHQQHSKFFVFEDLDQWDNLLEEYEKKFM